MNSRNVALIIPVYVNNDEQLHWFEECLQSASEQNCIVSIHDDGSEVDIGNVVSTYIKKNVIFSRSEQNIGVSHARNEAVKQVPDGSLILPLDCDDTLKPGTVERLVSVWNGIPLYTDIAKFGLENIEHYAIMEWDCSHLYNFVGFTSVNVLHSKEQWKTIGGWDESIDFYEDGEYNARLFGNFCAKRVPEPLVNYRIHAGQRTKKYSSLSMVYAKKILAMVRRLDMPCTGCGGKRRSGGGVAPRGSKGSSVQITGERGDNIMVDNASLPLQFEGKVLARYIGGKGKGKHYYQGIASKMYYRSVQYGDLVYADSRDVSKTGDAGTSKFVPIERPAAVPKPIPVAVPAPVSVAIVEDTPRVPKVDIEKEPVAEEEDVSFEDISKMSLKDIKTLEISCEDAGELIAIEERPAVVKYLKSLCSD